MIKNLYLNNELINLDLDKMKIIGEGKEGIVYKYNNECIKIFNSKRNNGELLDINEEKFIFFTKLETNNIILPRKLLYNRQNKIEGYIMPYIESDFDLNNIRSKNINEIISELKQLKKDIELLNENDILINDLKYSHLLYNNGFYLIDSSLYSKYQYDNVLNYDAYMKNMTSINDFLIDVLLIKKSNDNDQYLNINQIPKRYYSDKLIFISEVFEKEKNKYKINSLNELRYIYKKNSIFLKNK